MYFVNIKREYLFVLNTALYAVLSLLVPSFLGQLLLFLAVAPIIILLLENNYMLAFMGWLILLLVLTLYHGAFSAFPNAAAFLIYCFTYVYYIRKNTRALNAVVKTSAVYFSMIVLSTLLVYKITGFNALKTVMESLRQVAAVGMGIYYDSRIPADKIEILSGSFKFMVDFISNSLTAWLLLLSLAGSYIVYMVINRAVKQTPPLPLLRDIKITEKSIWMFIASILLFLLTRNFSNNNIIRLLASNTAVFMLFLYCISGLGILLFFLYVWNASRILKTMIFAVAMLYALMFGGYVLLIVVGISDIWLNYRSRYMLSLASSDSGEN